MKITIGGKPITASPADPENRTPTYLQTSFVVQCEQYEILPFLCEITEVTPGLHLFKNPVSHARLLCALMKNKNLSWEFKRELLDRWLNVSSAAFPPPRNPKIKGWCLNCNMQEFPYSFTGVCRACNIIGYEFLKGYEARKDVAKSLNWINQHLPKVDYGMRLNHFENEDWFLDEMRKRNPQRSNDSEIS